MQNPSVTYSQPGVYSATLQVTNPFGTNEVTQPNIVEVLDLPSSGFSYLADQTTVSFTNTSQNGDFYSWSFGDNSSSSEANPVHTYSAPGTYTVSLTVVNTCGANTLQQMITLISGTGDLAWLEQFRLYPNPSAGIFTVEMQGGSRRELEFWLFNPLGVLLAREKADFNTGTLQRQMDYSHLPAGFYTLQIRSGDSILPVKLAIQR
ncbi:MAG: PKD domain-containing protein [Saprospiraceae bacterium]|nr:PKD domain-containing protein [Saprospiraceae bacterium]